MKEQGVPVVVANCPRYFWKKSISELIEYCKNENIDVVINHMYSPVACAHIIQLKKKLPGIKILGYMHSDQRDIVTGAKGKLLYRPIIKRMQQCCEKVVAISEFVKQSGMEAYDLSPSKIEVIHNAVDLNSFVPSGRIHTDNVMKLIFVGRLIPEKGVHILLEALSMLPKDMPVQTQIVGYGIELEHLKTLARDLKVAEKTEYLGKRTDIPKLLGQADFFVHPAICQEGFGITLVEAMACGKPCIASDGGAIPEIVTEENGLLFELGSASALAEKLIEAYQLHSTDKYNIMSKNARAKAETFDISKMVQQLEFLYI